MDRQTRLFTVLLLPFPTAIQQWMEDKMTRVPKNHFGLSFCHLFDLFFLQTFASLVYLFPEIPGKHFLDTAGMNFSQCYSTALINKVLWNTITPSTGRTSSVSRGTQGNYWKAQDLVSPHRWNGEALGTISACNSSEEKLRPYPLITTSAPTAKIICFNNLNNHSLVSFVHMAGNLAA